MRAILLLLNQLLVTQNLSSVPINVMIKIIKFKIVISNVIWQDNFEKHQESYSAGIDAKQSSIIEDAVECREGLNLLILI